MDTDGRSGRLCVFVCVCVCAHVCERGDMKKKRWLSFAHPTRRYTIFNERFSDGYMLLSERQVTTDIRPSDCGSNGGAHYGATMEVGQSKRRECACSHGHGHGHSHGQTHRARIEFAILSMPLWIPANLVTIIYTCKPFSSFRTFERNLPD